MKYASFKPKEIEESILNFWKANGVVEKLRERNQQGPKFYFLEGPPYTSGRIHLGTAWNMMLKDLVMRYKRMQGFDVWDRMGYDMHGLPTAQKVMKKFDLKNKEDIHAFGLDKFVAECKTFCIEMREKMDEDFQRLGSSLDFSDPYQPITNEFMEAEWWLIKEAHEKGRLYRGLRTMHWDAATQSAVAKHETEYQSIKDISIYVKFQSVDDPKHYYVIWTTTPWTIPLNLAVMVNPELDYVDVKVGNEIWTLAKSLHEKVLEKAKVEDFSLLGEYKGESLEGKKYHHPLAVKEFLPEELQTNERLFSILLSKEYVDDSAGTGLVHCAPGCGPEDYEVGHLHHIPPFNCVDEAGFFKNFGQFTDWKAKTDDLKFIQAIDASGALLAKESYVHDYPHGERSHEPVIFRTTSQWFLKIEDLKEKMLEANKEIYWYPQTAKNAYNSWLENLRDNSITKQRFWGTPVPIWVNTEDEDDYIVIGSIKELEELSGKEVVDLHIPAIDEFVIQKDGKTYKRIPDVLDVWIDAGSASWNCLRFPQNKELFEKYFPADFILEGRDQVQKWFNLLMIMSMLGFEKAPFKNVYMHGFVTDVDGVKMSKSLGNVISPDQVIEKHSVDILRNYVVQNNAGEDLNFSWDELVVKSRTLNILWNLHKLLIDAAEEANLNPFKLSEEDVAENLNTEEKFMLSRLQSTIKEVTALMEAYHIDDIVSPLEALFLDLSRTYVQAVRDKLALGSREEKAAVCYTLGKVLFEGLKVFQLVVPFIAESMYQNFKEHFTLDELSISHYAWPKVEEASINAGLEQDMRYFASILQSGLNSREKANLGLRWPVKEFVLVSSKKEIREAAEHLKDLLKQQLNAKAITVQESLEGVKDNYAINFAAVGKAYGKLTQKISQHVQAADHGSMSQALAEGAYTFDLDGESIELTKEMLEISHEVPDQYKAADFKGGAIYLNTESSEQLLAEGYAREIMRQVQNMRKEAGLEKQNRIKLHIQCSQHIHARLVEFTSDIKEKVGADQVEISVNIASGAEHKEEFSIKSEKFVANFTVLS